jgi:hypothetical protein
MFLGFHTEQVQERIPVPHQIRQGKTEAQTLLLEDTFPYLDRHGLPSDSEPFGEPGTGPGRFAVFLDPGFKENGLLLQNNRNLVAVF